VNDLKILNTQFHHPAYNSSIIQFSSPIFRQECLNLNWIDMNSKGLGKLYEI
jgi:hypothetical protein